MLEKKKLYLSAEELPVASLALDYFARSVPVFLQLALLLLVAVVARFVR